MNEYADCIYHLNYQQILVIKYGYLILVNKPILYAFQYLKRFINIIINTIMQKLDYHQIWVTINNQENNQSQRLNIQIFQQYTFHDLMLQICNLKDVKQNNVTLQYRIENSNLEYVINTQKTIFEVAKNRRLEIIFNIAVDSTDKMMDDGKQEKAKLQGDKQLSIKLQIAIYQIQNSEIIIQGIAKNSDCWDDIKDKVFEHLKMKDIYSVNDQQLIIMYVDSEILSPKKSFLSLRKINHLTQSIKLTMLIRYRGGCYFSLTQ